METFDGEFELHHTRIGKNFEDATVVRTIVCDLELLEGENVCNPPGVKVYRHVAEVSFLGSLQGAFVAVYTDRVGGQTDISDVFWLGK